VLLRQELAKGFFGWLSYSISRSERKDRPDSNWRLFDYDQTNVLTLLASYEISHGFQAGARFRYTTGMPPYPGGGSLLQHTSQQGEPSSGAELDPPSAFYALDLRVEKAFVYRRLKFNLFADVQNVSNRKNPKRSSTVPTTVSAAISRGARVAGGRTANGVLMKTTSIGILSLFVLFAACEPKVGSPISLINWAGHPGGERRTGGGRSQARGCDLSVRGPSRGQRRPRARTTADISSPLLWAICTQPKPPTQSNSVSVACLDQNAFARRSR